MSDKKLTRMANDIAAFFQSYPHDEAVAGIHDHIRAFWTPRMRGVLVEAVASGTSDVHPLVAAAMSGPPPGHAPTDKEAAGPAVVGEIGASDAG